MSGAVQRVVERVGPHRLSGLVVAGFKRGSKELGWPTANLDPAAFEDTLDAETEGVYIGWASVSSPTLSEASREVHKAVLSVGWNPHFDDVKKRTVEVYICHKFESDFYGQPMKVIISAFLRPQAKFDSLDALIEAITGDVDFGQVALDKPELGALRHDPFFSAEPQAQ
jgi:FAD synthase